MFQTKVVISNKDINKNMKLADLIIKAEKQGLPVLNDGFTTSIDCKVAPYEKCQSLFEQWLIRNNISFYTKY